jgi:tetratricopeptide (TPR) repeat protein
MTAPMMSNDCLTEETLAAFVDDRLDDVTRRRVMEHLAACGECRELVLMVNDFNATEAPANVKRFGGRSWMAAAASLAAAAVIGVFVLRPTPLFSPDVDDVIAASAPMVRRPFEGRVAGMPYKEKPDTLRGGDAPQGDPASPEPAVDPEKLDLYITADKIANAWSPDLHAEGATALFMSRDDKNFDEPVQKLEQAILHASGDERDRVAIDLSAALLQRAAWSSQHAEKDLIQALLLSENTWRRNPIPEAAWNRAVALTNMGRTDQAIRAWDDYLELDGTSEWATEAKTRKSRLEDR